MKKKNRGLNIDQEEERTKDGPLGDPVLNIELRRRNILSGSILIPIGKIVRKPGERDSPDAVVIKFR